MIIAISGPDGAGKTTQISKLEERYSKKQKNIYVVWCRFFHLFTLFPLFLGRILNITKYISFEDGKVGFKNFSRFPLIQLYLFFLWLDYLLLYLKNIFVTRVLKFDIVLYDRHVFDLLVDIYIDCRLKSTDSIYLKPFKLFIDKSITYLFLLTDYRNFVNRRRDLMYDHTIKQKIQIYNKLANEYNIVVFDASDSPDLIHAKIINYVE